MSNKNINALYEYYLQQVCAESYLENGYQQQEVRTQLAIGTNRTPLGSSINDGYKGYTRLTDQQIDEFVEGFEVRHQWSDDPAKAIAPTGSDVPPFLANTGFSATLIYDKTQGTYTLAMRSTEFRDASQGGDAARDKTATDINEIGMNGFAISQLDAMEKYYAWLKSTGKIPEGATVNVTGYSLGGHLATVFTEIHRQDTDVRLGETVTFNGAGRGTWDASKGSLADMIVYFRSVLVDPQVGRADLGLPGIDVAANDLWAAALAVAGAPLPTRDLYGDARYAWAKYATFSKFDAGSKILFFSNLANHTPDTGTINTSTMGTITQVYGYETQNNTNFTANSGVHGPTVRVGIESQPLIEGAGFVFGGDFGNG
ncbi:MAG: hypothetical protein Q7V53_04280, partial [Caldisericota bacterium]|nr:hypothetical protein [Caldisericota bacterium]